MNVPPFLITHVIKNEEKQKSHFYFSCSDNSWMGLFRASLNDEYSALRVTAITTCNQYKSSFC